LPFVLDETPDNLKNGTNPNRPLPDVLDLKNFNPEMKLGVRATLGYLCCDEAIEVSGFYQWPSANTKAIANPGSLLLPYFTPTGAFPLGFEGDNGLWNHADLARFSYQSSVASAELNYRRWDIAVTGMELILGVRYFYTRETLSQYTNDDFFVVDPFGRSNLALAATYSVSTRNQILGPQVGAEYSFPVTVPFFNWPCALPFWVSVMGKAMCGPNWVERQFQLTRGDGFHGFDVTKNDVKLGQVYEADVAVDWHILDRLRLRAGYMALWAVGISNAAYQFDFNLADQGTRRPELNSAFWHGPFGELQFLW
jgi:hypothetical protein